MNQSEGSKKCVSAFTRLTESSTNIKKGFLKLVRGTTTVKMKIKKVFIADN